MSVHGAQFRALTRRWKPVFGLSCACLALAGCAASKDSATALLSSPAVAAKQQTQAAKLIAPQTGSLPDKTAPGPTAAGHEWAAATVQPPSLIDGKSKTGNQELYVDFQADSVTLSDKEKAALQEAVADRVLSGWSRISISAARGGAGNQFEQAIIAQKRARVVNEIIPTKMIELVEFDPTLPEDTVRLEFKRPPPAKS